MTDSQQILEHMCRACMCKDQTFHSLCDKSAVKSLTIHEMLATAIPQVAIHSNDELSKKICAACFNTLIIVHKFQQMCIASDAYMRSLLVSNRLPSNISSSNITEHQPDTKHLAMAQDTKLNIPLITQDPQHHSCSLKVEVKGEAVTESELLKVTSCYQEIDTMDPEWSDDDDIPLNKSGSLRPLPLEKKEFQNCMKFEASDMEMRECDLMTSLKSENVLLESRVAYNDESMATVLHSYKDSRHQKKSTSNVSVPEQHQPSIPSVDNETDVYKIEKPSSSFHEKYNFPCPYCDAVFSGKIKLEQHYHLHDKTRQFVCDICKYRFKTSKNLICHKKTHKMAPPGGFKCPKCPRRFEKEISIVPHMKSHLEYIFKCDLCPKKFIKLRRLTDHMRKHKNQKLMYEYEIDNTDTNLKQDIEDDNDKNLKWNDGDSSINQKTSASNLSKTEQKTPSIPSATNEADVFEIEKPYSNSDLQYNFPCPHCDAMFIGESNLITHSHVHDETRPLVCEVCNYRFQTITNLIRHKNTHTMTPAGGFKCLKCARRFEKQISLISHMKKHR